MTSAFLRNWGSVSGSEGCASSPKWGSVAAPPHVFVSSRSLVVASVVLDTVPFLWLGQVFREELLAEGMESQAHGALHASSRTAVCWKRM